MYSARKNFKPLSKRRSFGTIKKLETPKRHVPVSEEPSIRVAVRVRPENTTEKALKHRSVVFVPDEKLLVFDPIEEKEDFFFQGRKQVHRDISKKSYKNKTFCFDNVFDEDATNQEIFDQCAKPLVDGLLKGFNCSVFAYGATGSGKTFTMLGKTGSRGIIFLMVMELYNRIVLLEDKICDITISYLEVYNEAIKDLLNPSANPSIREDQGRVIVSGLSMHKPLDANQLLGLLESGNLNRSQHPTDANSESSRSHAVFQVYIKVKDAIGGISENIKYAKMSLVDLAGSERATVVQTKNKERLREGASINQSLLALGSCINALADTRNRNHIPYRNSKLTRILKDSLGGNCQTVMIANVSPSSASYDDTYNTLNYANRAKEIKVKLQKNAVNDLTHISKIKKVMERQQREIANLKTRLKQYEAVTDVVHETIACQTSPSLHIADKSLENHTNVKRVLEYSPNSPNSLVVPTRDIYASLDALFSKKAATVKEILVCESKIVLLQLKSYWRQHSYELIGWMDPSPGALQPSATKTSTAIKSGLTKQSVYEKRKSKHLLLLTDVESNIRKAIGSLDSSFEFNVYHRLKELEVKRLVEHLQADHVLEVTKVQQNHTEAVLRLSSKTLKMISDCHYLLKSYSALTRTNIEEYQRLFKEVESFQEVKWADQDLGVSETKKFLVLPTAMEHSSPQKMVSALATYLSPSGGGGHSYIKADSIDESTVPSFQPAVVDSVFHFTAVGETSRPNYRVSPYPKFIKRCSLDQALGVVNTAVTFESPILVCAERTAFTMPQLPVSVTPQRFSPTMLDSPVLLTPTPVVMTPESPVLLTPTVPEVTTPESPVLVSGLNSTFSKPATPASISVAVPLPVIISKAEVSKSGLIRPNMPSSSPKAKPFRLTSSASTSKLQPLKRPGVTLTSGAPSKRPTLAKVQSHRVLPLVGTAKSLPVKKENKTPTGLLSKCKSTSSLWRK